MIHPILPAGYNSWMNDGDEVNGAGVNEAVWPTLWDSFEGLPVLLMTPEMFSVFDGCADYVVPRQPDTVTFPPEVETIVIREAA